MKRFDYANDMHTISWVNAQIITNMATPKKVFIIFAIYTELYKYIQYLHLSQRTYYPKFQTSISNVIASYKHCEYQSFWNWQVVPATHVPLPDQPIPPHCDHFGRVPPPFPLVLVGDEEELVAVPVGEEPPSRLITEA
jgi:hypothetical protein